MNPNFDHFLMLVKNLPISSVHKISQFAIVNNKKLEIKTNIIQKTCQMHKDSFFNENQR